MKLKFIGSSPARAFGDPRESLLPGLLLGGHSLWDQHPNGGRRGTMREQWLAEAYHKMKKSLDARLSRALALLRKKARSDPEIAEALHLLRPWAPGQGREEEPNADGPSAV
jgi:hypothetical protein